MVSVPGFWRGVEASSSSPTWSLSSAFSPSSSRTLGSSFAASGASVGASRLAAELQRATSANSVQEVPQDALLVIVQSSYSEDDRHQIMQYLCKCLTEPDVAQWRKVYLALVLLEDLLIRGSKELLAEASSGHYFDIAQRLFMLTKYPSPQDVRVQNFVRRKAATVQDVFRQALKSLHQDDIPSKHEHVAKGAFGISVAYTTHNDDTTDEESGDERAKMPSVTRPKSTGAPPRIVSKDDEGSTTDDDKGSASPSSCGSRFASDNNSPSPRRRPPRPQAPPGRSFTVGGVCRSVSVVTMRQQESLQSPMIQDFDANVFFAVLEVGSGRRIKVQDLQSKRIGWISMCTSSFQPLAEPYGNN